LLTRSYTGHFQGVLNDLKHFEIEHLIITITVTLDLLLYYGDLEGVLQQWAMYQVWLVDKAGWRLPLFLVDVSQSCYIVQAE